MSSCTARFTAPTAQLRTTTALAVSYERNPVTQRGGDMGGQGRAARAAPAARAARAAPAARAARQERRERAGAGSAGRGGAGAQPVLGVQGRAGPWRVQVPVPCGGFARGPGPHAVRTAGRRHGRGILGAPCAGSRFRACSRGGPPCARPRFGVSHVRGSPCLGAPFSGAASPGRPHFRGFPFLRCSHSLGALCGGAGFWGAPTPGRDPRHCGDVTGITRHWPMGSAPRGPWGWGSPAALWCQARQRGR